MRGFAIVTCAANELVAPISDVMPVVLQRGNERLWLDPQLTDPEYLHELLRPLPASQMRAHRVSPAVLSPRNDSPEVIAPLEGGHAEPYFPDLS